MASLLCTVSYTQQITVKIATVAPEGSIWMVELDKMNQEIQRKTRGDVKFYIYAGGVAGEERSVVKKIQMNALDGAAFAGTGLGELMSHIRILELPFFYNDYNEWRYVYGKIVAKLEQEFWDNNYKMLGWTEGGFAYLYASDPIRNLDAFRKAKVWFYEGDALIEACFKELNAAGYPMGVTDVVTSLQTGKINCVYCPHYALMAMRWHTHVHYYTDLPIVNVMGGLVITKKAFLKIPKAHQKTVQDVSRKYMEQLFLKVKAENENTVVELRAKFNIQAVAPDASMLEETKVFSQKIARTQIGKLYTQEFFDEVCGYQEEFRKKK
jgi:TRAP-type C4-dicarboxylate transport system substrate-binding protein